MSEVIEVEGERIAAVAVSKKSKKNVDDFVPDTQPMVVVEDDEDSKLTSEEVREKVIQARDSIETSYMELCHYLYVVQKKRYWEAWGYGTFKEYVGKEIMFKKSKAFRLIQLWENLYVRQVDKDILPRMLKEIGWTKSVSLMFIINSENAEDWIEKAKHLNVEELDAEVKRYLKSLKPEDSENTSEALEKAEAIEDEIESTKPQDVHFQFVDFQDYMAVINALDVMKRIEPTLSNSQSIANICRDFLGTNMPGEDRIQSVLEYLMKYEAQFGLKLVVIKPDTDEILHGYEYLAEIAKKNRG